MSKPAVSVEGVSKAYRIGLKEQIPDTMFGALKGVVQAPFKSLHKLRRLNTFSEDANSASEEPDLIWALRDVSFDVQEGEVVGIIGRNGAGKSTLLKILSRITEPTNGQVVLQGRVSSLLEVGTGFHPEMSGRENVYMNGTILGMTKREIDRKFDEIVDFSGVEKFLDTPVKRYSSGMTVRLAFAVAAHLEPEILIIDEVLAVGDAEFQTKCLGKMQGVALSGRTVLFVSHNLAAVDALCTKSLLLDRGKFVYGGETRTAISMHISSACELSADMNLDDPRYHRPGSVPLLKRIRLRDGNGLPAAHVGVGESLSFEIDIDTPTAIPDAFIVIRIYNALGVLLMRLHTRHQLSETLFIDGFASVRCEFQNCRLVPGRYRFDAAIGARGKGIDDLNTDFSFDVIERDIYGTGKVSTGETGIFLPECQWAVTSFDAGRRPVEVPTAR